MSEQVTCKLCHNNALNITPSDVDGIHIKCEFCGEYGISGTADMVWKDHVREEHLPGLIDLLKRKKDKGKEALILGDDICYL